MPRKPTIRKGPAARYASDKENIYEFSDGRSGELISLRRHPDTGQLLVQFYNTDADVLVTAPFANPSRSGR